MKPKFVRNHTFELKVETSSGRGLYATELILPNTVLMECEIIVLSASDTLVLYQTELQFYTFKYNDSQDCLVLGLGEIFNHSDNANVSYQLVERDGRKVMQFVSVGYIQDGSQLFINYAADTGVEVSQYIENKSLIG